MNRIGAIICVLRCRRREVGGVEKRENSTVAPVDVLPGHMVRAMGTADEKRGQDPIEFIYARVPGRSPRSPPRFREGPGGHGCCQTRRALFSTRLMEKSQRVCGRLTDVDCTSSQRCAVLQEISRSHCYCVNGRLSPRVCW